MAILYPAAIGQDLDSTLFAKGSVEYKQNAGLAPGVRIVVASPDYIKPQTWGGKY